MSEAYIEELIKSLKAVYAQSREELVKTVTSADATNFARFRASALLQQVDREIRALDALAADFAAKGIPASYRRGMDIAAGQIRAMGLTAPHDAGTLIHRSAAQALAEHTAMELLEANRSMKLTLHSHIRKTQQTLLEEQAIHSIIAQGVVQGKTRREVSNRLSEALRKEIGEGKLVKAGKRNFKPDEYAEIVTRTRTREAVTAGSINSAIELDIDLIQISVHETSCPICRPFQGRVYSITGTTPGFPRLDKRPPFHPRCRHVALPVTEDHLESLGIKEALQELGSNPDIELEGHDAYQNFLDQRKGQKGKDIDIQPAKPTEERQQGLDVAPLATAAVVAGLDALSQAQAETAAAAAITRGQYVRGKVASKMEELESLLPHASDVPAVQLSMLKKFTDYGSYEVNRLALEGKPSKALDKLLRGGLLPGLKGYSRRDLSDVQNRDMELQKYRTGEWADVAWLAYSSSTLLSGDRNSSVLSNGSGITFVVLNKGIQGGYLGTLSAVPDEAEMLYGRNSKFRVVGWDEGVGKSGHFVYLEEVEGEIPTTQNPPPQIDTERFLDAWLERLQRGETTEDLDPRNFLR